MITYTNNLNLLHESNMKGFFVGWPKSPNQATFKKLLLNSDKVILALEGNKLIGFITAITDHTLIDLVCDQALTPFYQRLGFSASNAMVIRKYNNQDGIS